MIPFKTDAPLYHPPIGTIALISINILIHILLTPFGGGESLDNLCLNFGTINPIQWVTCVFLHASWMHVIGNMIALAPFGMIVEGKVGTPKFLLIYLAVGAGSSVLIQLLMIFGDGLALGASCAVFGLMAITMLWAPKNDLTVVFFIFIVPFVFDISVMMFCFITIGMELFLQIMVVGATGGTTFMTSALAHLIGAGIGGFIGYRLLVDRRVDCEGYDFLTIWRGEEGQKVETLEQEELKRQKRRERKQLIQEEAAKATQFINLYIQHEKPEMAVGRFDAFKSLDPTALWDPTQLSQVIKLFLQQKKWEEAGRAIEIMIDLSPEKADAFRLTLAEIHIEKLAKPMYGLRVLRLIVPDKLSEKNRIVFQRVEDRARELIASGLIEVQE